MLVAALALVAVMMGQLRQPETAARLERLLDGAAVPAAAPKFFSSNAAADPSRDGVFVDAAVARAAEDTVSSAASEAEVDTDGRHGEFQQLLTFAGWDAERLAKLGDGQPLSDEQREELLGLLRRLKTFDAAELAEWARTDVDFPAIADLPNEHRGELIKLAGRVQQVSRRTLPPDVAARLELPAYVECQLAVDDGGGVATIITARIPNAWTEMEPLDELATASGVFVKRLPAEGEKSAALFISPDVAWHPHEVREPYVLFGQSLLGVFGMDVGLLDTIEQRRSIKATEREAFYQMLDATGRAGANQLIRSALGNLEAVGREWSAEAGRIRALAGQSSGAADDAERKRLILAQEVERRVGDGRYSVAPLFNDPENQVGRLVALEGVARRAVRIDVGTMADGTPSDVRRRFGIDHYFELELFTDDSQNNPVVFCVRELPPGFPTGESIREPVRVAGFFFKSWSFRSRRAGEVVPDGGAAVGTRQFAPLLVGRGPIWLQTPSPAGTSRMGLIVGGLFVVLIAAIWAAIWWFGRGQRRSPERELPERLSLPDGHLLVLDDLAAPPEDRVVDSSPPTLGSTGDDVRLQ
jgi:hypothetical protein